MRPRPHRRVLTAPFLPTVTAVCFVWLSLTPSLLPRPSLFQGLLCGVAAAGGYALGALVGWLLRRCGLRLVGRTRRRAWITLAAIALPVSVVVLWWYVTWQGELRRAVGTEPLGAGHLTLLLVVGTLVLVVLVGSARGVRAVGRAAGARIGRLLPPRAAVAAGTLAVALLGWAVVDGVVAPGALGRLDATFMALDDEFKADRPAPVGSTVSGGPDSLVAWDELGRQGRVLVSNAPSADEIASFTGEPALPPVRAYVGVGSDQRVDLVEEARLAVAELDRLGGFDRNVINVVTGTGRGWVNENQALALEFMWGGDTATVSIQYSYLPSWMSYLLDSGRARRAGRLLFDAVHERWLRDPPRDRARLVVSGESLGSFGAEAAFRDLPDLAARTDGALFVGPTGDNVLWREITDGRDPASQEILPVYGDGRIVRFADRAADWDRPSRSWVAPRIGYLQHPNDPITWWTWSLAVHRPDWLEEPRGRDVLQSTTWIPFVTMLQVGADQFVANAVPPGQGHDFGQEPVSAWARILPSPGWTPARTLGLRRTVAERDSLE